MYIHMYWCTQEARLQYTNENGDVKYETVRVKESEIDFEAENEYFVVFDYEKVEFS